MAPQMQNEKPPKQISRVFIMGIIALMSISALVWILSSEGFVQGTWATIFNVVFAVFGGILGLLQWYAQISTGPDVPFALLSVPRDQTTNNKLSWRMELGLNDGKGALIVYTNRRLHGTTIGLTSGFNIDSLRPHITANVVQRNGNRCHIFAGVFPSLEPGNYTVHVNAGQRVAKVTVLAGYAVEIDWR